MRTMIIFLSMVVTLTAWAEGAVYPGPMKIVGCDNATTREDGTPLPVEEIKYVEIGLSQNADGSAPVNFFRMPGGCTDTEYDLTNLPSTGQWYIVGWTIDTKEQYSKPSAVYPFIYDPVKARPKSPVITQ